MTDWTTHNFSGKERTTYEENAIDLFRQDPGRFSSLRMPPKCFGLICVLLCLFFSFNALAYEDIIPPGHKPARSGDQEDIQSLPEESLFYSPFFDCD